MECPADTPLRHTYTRSFRCREILAQINYGGPLLRSEDVSTGRECEDGDPVTIDKTFPLSEIRGREGLLLQPPSPIPHHPPRLRHTFLGTEPRPSRSSEEGPTETSGTVRTESNESTPYPVVRDDRPVHLRGPGGIRELVYDRPRLGRRPIPNPENTNPVLFELTGAIRPVRRVRGGGEQTRRHLFSHPLTPPRVPPGCRSSPGRQDPINTGQGCGVPLRLRVGTSRWTRRRCRTGTLLRNLHSKETFHPHVGGTVWVQGQSLSHPVRDSPRLRSGLGRKCRARGISRRLASLGGSDLSGDGPQVKSCPREETRSRRDTFVVWADIGGDLLDS